MVLDKVSTQNLFFKAYAEIIHEVEKPNEQRQLIQVAAIEAEMDTRGRFPWIRKNAIGPIFISILMPAVEKVLDQLSLAEVDGAVASLSFALKRYYQDHGELPESLSTLVPGYITGIPVDPFDGETLRYSKAKAILYSVGNDFLDDG